MIGYVLKMYPRFSETFILGEVLELERRGRSISLISLRKPDDGCFHEDLSRVRAMARYLPERLPGEPLPYLEAHWRSVRESPRAYLRAAMLAVAHLPGSWKGFLRGPLVAASAKDSGCRRLHAHFASLPAITAMFASSLSGIPFTFTAHAKDIYTRGRSRRLLRLLISRAARVVTVSDYNLRHLEEIAGASTPGGRIVRIYNGVDLGRFGAPEAAGGEDPPLILAVGRLVEKKGFADLIDACARLRDRGARFQCVIAGKGPLREDLARRLAAHDLAGTVALPGPLPQEEVKRLLRRAAFLVVPSVIGEDGNREGLPQVILEAMATGIPVVATRLTGIPEAVVDGITGFLTEPADRESLAAVISELLADPSLRVRMGMAGRRRAEQLFDLSRNIRALDEIFTEGPPSPHSRTPVRGALPSEKALAMAGPAESGRRAAARGDNG